MAAAATENSSILLSHNRKPGAKAGTSINITAQKSFLTKHFKIFKRKGVILVLLWILSSQTVFNFLLYKSSNHFSLVKVDPALLVISSLLLYPLLGWLADVHFSRYRVIKWFLRIMWLESILLCLISLLLDKAALLHTLYISLIVGFGGFQANIIQFGADQLVDASSSEISSFISWFIWLGFFGDILVLLSLNCICVDHYKSIPLLLLPLCLTISVSSDYIFNSCLVKEPPSSNPLTLIYKVLKYAAKNKYPRLRSAFTYWEDNPISRIDLGKSKYGGPFTTEEVENVKTFWRLFGIIIIGSIFMCLHICTFPATDKIFNHLQGLGQNISAYSWYGYCLEESFYSNFGSFVRVCFLPLYEFILDPFLKKYFHIPFKRKFIIGIIFFLLSLIGYIVIEGVGHHLNQYVHYGPLTCPMDSDHVSNITIPLNRLWTLIPQAFDGIAKCFFFLGALKFTYAQSPYSMKGLILGLVYGCVGLFILLSFCLLLLVDNVIEKLSPPRYGCEIWHLLFILTLLLVITGIACLLLKVYKLRFRDEGLKNEQMFAVQYYSQLE